MGRTDWTRGPLVGAIVTVGAIAWVLSGLLAMAASLAAALAAALGPLVALLWAEHVHPSSILVVASAVVGAITLGALAACCWWRSGQAVRWFAMGGSFALGQVVLAALAWRDRAAVPLWLAGLPAATVAVFGAVAFGCLFLFAVVWEEGKGFGT